VVERDILRTEVEARLGDRALVWAGLRGDDIEAIADLPNLTASFSIISRYRRRSTVDGVAYEDHSGSRPDLEAWDIDDHRDSDAAQGFRRQLLAALAGPSALLPYRASRFLSAIHFARQDRCLSLGLFGALQSAFEHKPWVESSLAAVGLPTIGWTYVADEEQLATIARLRTGPLVLRKSRTSGGEGFARIDSADELVARWPATDEGFVSVAPFLGDAVPVNVGGTVWRDGVSVHLPSVQLTGIPSCVQRAFGHCGNDFSAARALDPAIIDQLDQRTRTIGGWLAAHGYRGTFGVDYLVREGEALFTEVNPRFQGSTSTSARLSIGAGQACLYLEHLAAMLDVPAPRPVPLREAMAAVDALSSIVVHWLGPEARTVDVADLTAAVQGAHPGCRVDVAAPPSVAVEPGATVCRITAPGAVTSDGKALDPALDQAIAHWHARGGQRTAHPPRRIGDPCFQ
jgi:hypothetical protein